MIKKILFLSIFVSLLVYAKSYDEKLILKKAYKGKKQLIVFAYSKTCHFCEKMKREVLSLKSVKNKIHEHYILLAVDVDKSILPFSLQSRFKGITPTIFIVSKTGKYLNSYPGAWTKKDFLDILKENL